MDDALNRQLLTLLRDGARRLSEALGWHAGAEPTPYDLIKVDARRPVMRDSAFSKRGAGR
jgi:hypothetical protein